MMPVIYYEDAHSPCPKCGQTRYRLKGLKKKMFHMNKCSVARTRRINEFRKDAGLELLRIPRRKKPAGGAK
jgi:hypothetical protein